jgi:periplasmic protein TonB
MVLAVYTQKIPRGATRRASALLRLSMVIAAHAAALLALMQLSPTMREQLAPVFVSLITPPQPPAPTPTAMPPATPPALQKRQLSAPPRPAPASPKVHVTMEPVPAAISAEPAAASAVVPGTTETSASIVSAPAPVATVKAVPAVIAPRFDAAYLNNPRPEYPRLARRMGEHGKVTLRVFVSSAGMPDKVEIRSSSGSPRLDQAAREAVEQWKFVPARQGEEPVAAWVLVPITFVLEG